MNLHSLFVLPQTSPPRLEKSGRNEEAMRCYREALADDPHQDLARQRLQLLTAITEKQVCKLQPMDNVAMYRVDSVLLCMCVHVRVYFFSFFLSSPLIGTKLPSISTHHLNMDQKLLYVLSVILLFTVLCVCPSVCLPGCLIITYQFCVHVISITVYVHPCMSMCVLRMSRCLLHCVCVCVCVLLVLSFPIVLCNWRLLNVERRNEKSWKKRKHFERFRNFLTEKWLKHLSIPARKPSRQKGKWFKYSDSYYI